MERLPVWFFESAITTIKPNQFITPIGSLPMPPLIRAGSICAVVLCVLAFSASPLSSQSPPRTMIQAPPPVSAILTPAPGPAPRINGPVVYGCRPGNPFLYRIPCTGDRPIIFSAGKLPAALRIDPVTGLISGTAPVKGEYGVTLRAKNRHGASERRFRIVSGDRLALTPPMGWNHWYAHYWRITDSLVREAADIMIAKGMADAGYQYVNIDDCWMNSAASTDPLRVGPLRDDAGKILPNRHFPDMKSLTEYIHTRGLKAGIYTSPGPLTCDEFSGSYGHESADAKQFASWGFDFLKYDWCSYEGVVGGDHSRETLMKPYRLMGEILRRQDRDIILNFCQYGLGNVWEWGEETGGQSWRTANDLGIELDRIFEVALKNAEHRAWSRPGSWNDPDYIQIGYIGDARVGGGGLPAPSKLSPNEQYAYMSLWCLMASPLFYSGEMGKLDPFTLNVLCNPEVIDIDQDPLGQSASVSMTSDSTFLMVKDLEDGSKALGLFNRGRLSAPVTASWALLGLKEKQSVRDLWREKDLANADREFSASVPPRGVVLVRLHPLVP